MKKKWHLRMKWKGNGMKEEVKNKRNEGISGQGPCPVLHMERNQGRSGN